MKRFLAVRVFPWVVVLAGGAATYIGLDVVRLGRESLDWPAADGVIVRSAIETETSRTGGSSQPSVTYRPVVVYQYTVEGAGYEGNRISYGAYATGEESDAARVVRAYSTGARVRVRYRPGDPHESVLEPGLDGLPWFFLGLGAIFIIVGVVLAVAGPKMIAVKRGLLKV